VGSFVANRISTSSASRDVGLSGVDDLTVLEWAAGQGRVVVSHDVSTLRKHAYERVAAGLRMPGVFEVGSSLAIGRAIDDLLLIVACSLEGEWEGQVRYLPL
jgi:hypothetical protein